ncbi:TrlF family AAA-like ATPase [Azotobacter beijerinckii]|uniref:TrlF family AAA-like ATPase n=1 Tax=Azotobacter beijerinckii TaxID=170623 RepID=UPI002953A3EC|nr:AAA family ATPase [Azotobacter beijerinckii]MDV7210103.1 AAA family ATPase [Azotobacter beijerinckii]
MESTAAQQTGVQAEITGSSWKRWDPHIHAPGTLLNNQFKRDWDLYLNKLESVSPTIQALGITDYFSIESYRRVLAWKKEGRLANVSLIFPNVEMRLDIKTEKAKGINLHLLFSPDDPEHEEHIDRLLSKLTFEFRDRKYACNPTELAQLGRAVHGVQIDGDAARSVGANAFKTSFNEVKQLLKDGWAQQNCLVAVSGSSGDGTAGLQGDSSYAATRQEIERFAHIIFSANPSTRKFWLGQGAMDRRTIEKTYRFLKPCLHGCDAHDEGKVGQPTGDRFCWIKGDLTFDTLRQTLIEPEERVWIGSECPSVGLASYSIREMSTTGTEWLKNESVRFNPGLVTVIGARGSGKTALVELLAAGTHSVGEQVSESSFLARASKPKNYLKDASIEVLWRDDTTTHADFKSSVDWDVSNPAIPVVRYLSQQFVDKLCSASGLATELRREVERVVFEAIDPVDRLEADTFSELADKVLQPIRSRQQSLRQRIERLSEQIASEDISHRNLKDLKQKQTAGMLQLEKLKKEAEALIPKGGETRAKELAETEAVYRAMQQRVERLNLQQQRVSDLSQTILDLMEYDEPGRWHEMQSGFASAGLSEEEWSAFKLVFAGDVHSILAKKMKAIRESIKTLKEGHGIACDHSNDGLNQLPLNELEKKLEVIRKEVGIDTLQQKKYDELQAKVRGEEVALKRLAVQIETSEGADVRKKQLIATRREMYLEVFQSFIDEEAQLQKLYAPLAAELQDATGALAKLKVVVKRRVSLDAWAITGEKFIDLRVAEKLRGKGTLRREAEQYLLEAWSKGLPKNVAEAMEAFRETFVQDLTNSISKSLTMEDRSRRLQEIAAWLYDTSHIYVEYGIAFDGVEIEKLSPGTRGIVLLLLYLAIDKRDRRPLIVDQPEENLDPQSVYDELVPHFREARKRRQVILVTHNANLVVNTDADQVIVASSQRGSGEGLPTISYKAGALENCQIRQAVCNLLEGGDRAFLERERRYRFRWDDILVEGDSA